LARLYLATGIEGIARRRPWVMRLVWAVEAAALALFWGAMALLPIDWASAIGARLLREFPLEARVDPLPAGYRLVQGGRIVLEPPPGARSSLQAYISRLRKVLGSQRIEGRSGGYVLPAPPPPPARLRGAAAGLLRDARR
jgi:hypothetical protein